MDWWTYRVPIAEGAERDAERVAAHYAAARVRRTRRTRPARKLWTIGRFVATVALFIVVVGWLTGWR